MTIIRKTNTRLALFLAGLLALPLAAQNAGTLRGTVTDPSAAVAPGVIIQISGNGIARQTKSDNQGKYSVALPAGTYAVRADAKGFVTFTQPNLNVAAGQATALDIALQIAAQSQEVQVNEEAAGQVNTDPSANVGAIVMKGEDLEQLPDDPDDLQSDLEALAGPAAGPNGAQFFVDGFSGGQLPPKSSIREIRINSNPFSSEFDRPGFGRIEIFTKPGTDSWHGGGMFNFGDKVFDSRNPFLTSEPPAYQSEFFGANIGGPLNKKASFFLDFNRRDVTEEALINGESLDSSFNKIAVNSAYQTPQKFFTIGPRVDYQLNATNTLVARYNYMESSNLSGVGSFNLPSQAQHSSMTNHSVQLTETAILGTKAVDETRFQFRDNQNDLTGSGAAGPTINVANAFTAGGAPLLSNDTGNKGYEVQNNLTVAHGAHALKFGVRVRESSLVSVSTSNFNGTYTFTSPSSLAATAPCLAGISNPTSLDVYRQTQILLSQGVPMSSVIAQGCGPTQFTLNSGVPRASVNQFDAGIFAQDDWRVRPNLTVSAGLRYEMQTNIGDHADFAPRLAVAWAPGSKGSRPGKTVIRVGSGFFYDRFDGSNTLQALRYNGVSQLNYNINSTQNPAAAAAAFAAYPGVPSTSLLALQNQALYEVSRNFQAPYIWQSAASLERALPGNTKLSMNFVDTRGVHVQRQRDINAYLPGTYNPLTATGGVRPFAGQGDIYLYESSGLFKQTQLMTNVSNRLNSHVSLQGFYVYGHAHTNVNGFPSNQYDTSQDWGRSNYDVRHRAFIGGTVGLPFRVSAAPFITINSAPPFNITTGTDYNGDGIYNDRPAFATSASNPKNVRVTQYGAFDLAPAAGAKPIPVNYGDGFGSFSVNLRLSRTWGWGERNPGGLDPSMMGRGGPGGPGGPPPGGGGGGGHDHGPGGFGGGMGPMMGGFGGGGTGKKYNLTATISARNALNHVNLAAPNGALNSPFFGESLATAGGFGGGPGGPGFGGGAGNRKVELQLRFQF